MISISKQLRKYFIVVTVLAVLVIFLLSNFGMTVFFRNYVKSAELKSDHKIVQYLEDLFSTSLETGAAQSMGVMPGLRQFLRGEEAVVKLYASDGSLLLDTAGMGNMHGPRGQGHGKANSPGMGREPGNGHGMGKSDLDLLYREYPLKVAGGRPGKVAIGREKTIFSAAEDRAFLLTMNAVFILALGLAVLLAFILSKSLAGKFLKPLLVVKNNIEAIADSAAPAGRERLRPVFTQTKEIQELALATEELAHTLEEQNKLRKRLTSDLAHELRTPLATLQSQLEAMIDGIWEATPERLSYCNDELIRLTGLINDLNELSVLESTQIQFNSTQVDFSKLVEEICENSTIIFREKSIEFASEAAAGLTLKGDSDKLRQVVLNIISNAYKYTPQGGRVAVSLKREGNWALLEIKDSGQGIAAADLPHIFERFYRGDLSRSRESGGAGIGLTIAKALVEAHQGTVEIESELGLGTKVTIKLPLI
jgi:two-component system sensor histidine kinase BaeS